MIKRFLFILIVLFPQTSFSNNNDDFKVWLEEFKVLAIEKGISEETVNLTFKNARYLPKVIEYDRRQPEFFEDTKTYIKKRATRSRTLEAKKLFLKNKKLFNEIESKFNVEKEIILALWGIETNFGKYVGKMDIISSLATLSYDKRRSKFFSKELLTLLNLIDRNLIFIDTLFGSWAGAFGNFQFMPSTIDQYAIDYDNNKKIDLKNSLDDSVASAANYINKIGWKAGSPCFYKVKVTKKINDKYINTSAKNIKNKLSIKTWKKKGIVFIDDAVVEDTEKAALILPDGNAESPAFLVFDNYEKILMWNRSLRFGVTVCTLSNLIKDEI